MWFAGQPSILMTLWGSRYMRRDIKSLTQFVVCLAIVAAMPAVALAAKGTEKTENYPSGKPKATYTVNEAGLRDGPYKEFYEEGGVKVQAVYRNDKLDGSYKELYPSGKPKLKTVYRKGLLSGKYAEYNEKGAPSLSAVYREGKLNGVRKELNGRKSIKEDVWLDGEILLPKSPAFLKKQLKAISKAKIEIVGETPQTPAGVGQRIDDPQLNEHRANAMRRLMMYRAACNLPFEGMVLDRTWIAHAEAGSMVLAKLGQISHEPPNPGVAEDLYQFGRVGTMNSNLQHSSPKHTMADSVRDFMWDTDHPANVVRLGHRRWSMHPNMLKVGFGKTIVDKHSSILTMWASDNSRKEVPDYEMFGFPAQGIQPVSLLRRGKPHAWSMSFNAAKYQMPSDQELKVKVVKCQFDAKRFRLKKGKDAYALEHVHVSIEQFSYPPAVIFQPKDLDYRSGNSYWVEISGVKHANGTPAEIGYLVSFQKL